MQSLQYNELMLYIGKWKDDHVPAQCPLCVCSATSNSLYTIECSPPNLHRQTKFLCIWNFPGKNTGTDCHFLLQGIFPTQESNPHLLHWQADPLPLNHQSPYIPNYNSALEIALEAEQWRCIAGLAAWEQTASWKFFTTVYQERSIGCIPGTRVCVNLLKQWNYIWKSSCNWRNHLVDFMKSAITFQEPSLFSTGQVRQVE